MSIWWSEMTSGGGGTGAVDSVNGDTGVVVLDADDISDALTTKKFTTAGDISKLAGIEAGADVNTVDSVNTQTGAVVLDADDISDAATTNVFANSADLGDLANVTVTSVDVDDILSYNGTAWVNIPGYTINDAGSGLTDIWSASKLTTDLAGKQAAMLAEGSVWVGNGSSVPTATALSDLNVNNAVYTHTTTTGAITLGQASGIYQKLTLSGNPTFSVSGFTTGYAHNLILKVVGLADYTLTWPSGFSFEDAIEPTWVTGKTYYLNFLSDDGGTTGVIGVNGSFVWA